jgi:hypothetical protein
MQKETFNDYLMAVDRIRNRAARRDLEYDWREDRANVFYMVAIQMRPELAPKLTGTKRDPRSLSDLQLDTWLGWFVYQWNVPRQSLRNNDLEGDENGKG